MLLTSEALPLLTEIPNNEALGNFSAEDDFVLIGLIDEADTESRAALTEFATKRRGRVAVGIGGRSLAKEINMEMPAILALRVFDEPTALRIPQGSMTIEDLEVFFRGESVPRWNEYDMAAEYDPEIPLAIYYTDKSLEEHKEELALLRSATEPLHRLMIFTWINATISGIGAELHNLEVGKWPAFAIIVPQGDQHTKYTLQENVTPAAIAQFCQDFLRGEVAASVRSAEPPAEQGDVVEVVASEFSSHIFAEGLDVLFTLYRPGCSPCRELNGKLDNIAKDYIAQGLPVRIAKFNAEINDLPPTVGIKAEGVPALLLKTSVNTLIPYAGSLNEVSLRRFIEENGSHVQPARAVTASEMTGNTVHDEL